MSFISQQGHKFGITDPKEISMLEAFFQSPEIQGALELAEKYRILRYYWIIGSTLLITLSATFFGAFSGMQIQKVDFGQAVVHEIGIKVAPKEPEYRPITTTEGFAYGMIASLIFSMLIIMGFRTKIDGSIKQKVLPKLAKIIYSGLEYDEGGSYRFGDLRGLVERGFIQEYDVVDTMEDSIAFRLDEDGKKLSVRGYELVTSRIERGRKGRNIKYTTNHCFLMKVEFPSARIMINDVLMIRPNSGAQNARSFRISLKVGFLVGFMIPWGFFFWDTFLFNILAQILSGFLLMGIVYFTLNGFKRKAEVNLENTEFEKLYDVRCSNQVESRMIITPAFMDRLIRLSKRSGMRYYMMYEGNCFYIKWNIGSFYLEIDTWKKITENIGTFLEWYNQMKEILIFIHGMRLLYYSKISQPDVATTMPTAIVNEK